MNKISVLPRHNAISLSKDFTFERLQGHTQQQIFPQNHTTPLKEDYLKRIQKKLLLSNTFYIAQTMTVYYQ